MEEGGEGGVLHVDHRAHRHHQWGGEGQAILRYVEGGLKAECKGAYKHKQNRIKGGEREGGANEEIKVKVKVKGKGNEGLEKMGMDEKSGVKRKREGT